MFKKDKLLNCYILLISLSNVSANKIIMHFVVELLNLGTKIVTMSLGKNISHERLQQNLV